MEPRLDEERIIALLRASQGEWIYLRIFLAIATGMRRGEIAALRWQDINFDQHFLTVNQSLEETAAGLRFKGPKSRKPRSIRLDPVTVEVLKQARKEQAELRALTVGRGVESDLVVCHATGEPYLPGSITHAFVRIRDQAKVPLRFHDLRHFQATYLGSKGVHIAIIQDRLGHADINTTRKYFHTDGSMQAPAIGYVEELLKGWSPPSRSEPGSDAA